MKTRRAKSEQRSDARHDLKAVQDALRKPLVIEGPFDYAARAQQVQEAYRLNSTASELRFRPPQDPQAWELHKLTAARFWEAMKAAYPPGFVPDDVRLHADDAAGLENALAFLEADPFFYRTGYVKAKLIRDIKRLPLTPPQSQRLQQVVLNMVDARNDREFRAFCRLARKVDAPALREQLTARLTSGDAGIRRRARWVLEALAQKDSQEKGTRG